MPRESSDPLQTIARSDRWEICAAATGRSVPWLMARDLCTLEALKSSEGEGAAALARRMARAVLDEQPLAQVVGHTQFFGRRFWVNQAVLIPRSDSECLIHAALGVIQQQWPIARRALRILDLGTGSGCLAITLALEAQTQGIPVEITATDLSADALRMAKSNAVWLGASVIFLKGSWTEALPSDSGQFDLILSNPPYLSGSDPHLADKSLQFEPMLALVGVDQDSDGLQAYRAIVPQARSRLEPSGALLVEHGWTQQAAVADLIRSTGFTSAERLRDLAGRPRAVLAHL